MRHGETEWSSAFKHTSRTDIPLTASGEESARVIAGFLRGHPFGLVMASPMRRARATCELAGYGQQMQLSSDLVEWDYGVYEGLTTAEIRQTSPGWNVWEADIVGGETAEQVGQRADRVIDFTSKADGDALLFGHAHMLRILAARWLNLPAVEGRHLALTTGAACVLGYERETRVIRLWNHVC